MTTIGLGRGREMESTAYSLDGRVYLQERVRG